MIKVSVIGLFCNGKEVSDGQSIKTRIVTSELEKALGRNEVQKIDTYGWKKSPFRLFWNTVSAVVKSDNVIFMTDEGGIKVFPWLLLYVNVFYHRKLHYVVIGGWLAAFLQKHKFIADCLKKFDNIFVETNIMQKDLCKQGFTNVSILPNCKNLIPIDEKEIKTYLNEPFRFCTFSRVMKEKGIEDAVKAIKAINKQYGRTVCTLDIYGAVDPEQKEWFQALSSRFSEEIHYCGVVSYDRSVEVLKEYFMLLFPTYYTKEGLPGTIIDAYAAGVPVIASKWSGFFDVIDEGLTGIGYPWMENELLKGIIEQAIRKPQYIQNMKKNCLVKINEYLPENVMKRLLDKLV